jgi:hypothetical protein
LKFQISNFKKKPDLNLKLKLKIEFFFLANDR